jgi:hypothetical protein
MKAENPKTRYGNLKVKLQLVPTSAKIAIARALEEGAEKYSPWNWRETPVPLMTYVGACCRHLDAFVEGEMKDPDSDTKEHLDGAIGSLAIIIDAMSLGEGNYIDDRPSVSSQGALESLKKGSRKCL